MNNSSIDFGSINLLKCRFHFAHISYFLGKCFRICRQHSSDSSLPDEHHYHNQHKLLHRQYGSVWFTLRFYQLATLRHGWNAFKEAYDRRSDGYDFVQAGIVFQSCIAGRVNSKPWTDRSGQIHCYRTSLPVYKDNKTLPSNFNVIFMDLSTFDSFSVRLVCKDRAGRSSNVLQIFISVEHDGALCILYCRVLSILLHTIYFDNCTLFQNHEMFKTKKTDRSNSSKHNKNSE